MALKMGGDLFRKRLKAFSGNICGRLLIVITEPSNQSCQKRDTEEQYCQ
ncbi:hypothetical protein [Mariprofundus aestuarium]|nr:hypothetical protein [Mariprofundus aestuarium]